MYLDCISAHILKYNTIHARYMYLDCHTWTDTKDGKHFARIIETKMGYVIQQGEVASGPGGVEEDVESSDSEPSEDDDAQARPRNRAGARGVAGQGEGQEAAQEGCCRARGCPRPACQAPAPCHLA